MRYTTECPDRKKFYGFYAQLHEDAGDTTLYDQTYDLALKGSGKRAISNRDFLKKLMTHFIATTAGPSQ
jgi:hypothetical protein